MGAAARPDGLPHAGCLPVNLTYLSVCSGIEAATQAWEPLGWKPVAFSQFDPEHKYKGGPDFASAVLAVHYPDVPNLGDMTKFEEWPDYAGISVLVGGTPCQSYSVAGLRAGLDDPRGDLMLTYVAIARRYRPAWFVWENVPGVLSDDGGRSFGTFLGLVTGKQIEAPAGGWKTAGFVEGYKSAYGVAWRVLDSQHVRVDRFGRAVPQRRRRVFVVGYLGNWRRAAAVLFELAGLSGDSPPRREAGQIAAPTISARTKGGGGVGTDFGLDGGLTPSVANPLTARMHKGVNTTMDEGQTMIPAPFAFKAPHFTRGKDGAPADVYPPLSADADKGDQDPLVCAPIAFNARQDPISSDQHALPLDSDGTTQAIAFSSKDYGGDAGEISPTLRAMHHDGSHANGGGQVAVAFQPRFARNGRGAPDVVAAALTGEAGRTGEGDSAQCVAIHENQRGEISLNDTAGALNVGGGKPGQGYPAVAVGSAWRVRRLTPTECERLQGMRDGYTNIPWRGKNGAPDGPRYRALGNSMSVNVMAWIGHRIEMVENIFMEAQKEN